MGSEETVRSKYIHSSFRTLDRIVSLFEKFLYFIAALMIVLMVLFITYGVVGRLYFDLRVAWTVELAEYTIAFMTFLAASWILKKDGHVQVDIITSNVSARTRKIMMQVSYIIVMIGCALLFYYSAVVTIDHLQRGVDMQNITRLPKYLILMPIPLGFLLLTLRAFLKMVERKDEDEVEEQNTITEG